MDAVFVFVLCDVLVDQEGLALNLLFQVVRLDCGIGTLHFSELDITLVLISDHLDRQDFSKFFEEVCELLLGEIRGNVLYKQVRLLVAVVLTAFSLGVDGNLNLLFAD